MNPVNSENKILPQDKNNFLAFSTVIAFPALIVFLAFCIVPFYKSFIIAFKDFNPVKGTFNSPWVGLKHFQQFFQSPYGPNILQNTLIISILSIVFGGIYVFLLTLGIASIKNKWIKAIITSIAILPALIPTPILVAAISKTAILRDPSLYRFTVIANEVFCIAAIAILAGTFACMNRFDMKKVCFITLGYVVVRFMLLFSSNLDYIITSYNPLVYETADVIATYVYRQGLATANYSSASMAYVIKIFLQTIPTIIGTIAIILMSKRIQNEIEQDNELSHATNSAAISSVIAIIPAILFIWVIITTVTGMNIFTNPFVTSSLINSFVLSIISCILVTIFSLSLAYGMVVDNKFILICNSIFLLLSGNIMGQYMHIRSLGLINTYIPIFIQNSLYASIGAYLIYFAVGGINKISFAAFLKKSLPMLVAMFGICFAKFYGTVVEPMIYMNDRRLFPISLILRELLILGGNQEGENLVLSTIVLLLIPTLIGIAGIWLGVIISSVLDKTE